MFEAVMLQGAVLKKIVESLKDLFTDANLDCTQTGITMQNMDGSHVALCYLKLRSSDEGFESFRCDRSITLGLNLKTLSKILKCAASDDIITMTASDEPNTLTFVFASKNGDKVSTYDIKLMEIDSEVLGIPDVEHSCSIKMPSSEFQRICNNLSQIGDAVTIICQKNCVEFKVNGDDGSGSVQLKPSTNTDKDEDQILIELNDPVTQSYALKFLCAFCKASSLSDIVSISMTKDTPIVVEYPIPQHGYIRFYLAPKIEEDEAIV